ncbi:MAG: OpgC domain-containing protein, partial [Planctomycetota bacterium]
LRRRLGWVLLLISAAAYGFDLAMPGVLLLPLQDAPDTSTFLIPRWQGFFVVGMWAGFHLKQYDAWRLRSKLALVTVAALGTFVCHLLAYGAHHGLHLDTGLVFWKQVLTVPEFVRYLCLCTLIFAGTGLAWRWLERPLRPMATLGRHALPVYVFHVYLLWPTAWLSAQLPMPDAAKLLWLVLGVTALWGFAVGVERLQRAWKPTRYVAAPALVVLSVAFLWAYQVLSA